MDDIGNTGERTLNGIAASRGVCRGKLFVLRPEVPPEIPRYAIAEEEFVDQQERLERALVTTRQQLHELKQKVGSAVGTDESRIFDAQLLVLEDPALLEEVKRMMVADRVNVEQSFTTVAQRFVDGFSKMEDPYMRERATDIRDVTRRVTQNLLSLDSPADLSEIQEPCILLAHDLTPSQTAVLDRRMILGFATDQGSATSHSAILARALNLPAVTGLQDATQRLHSGQYVLLDGFNGHVILHPTEQTLYEYGQLAERFEAIQERLTEIREQPAVTMDGQGVVLSANIEGPEESSEVLANGAEGVGLFRTEFLFLDRSRLPTEEEQYEAYRTLAETLAPAPVIIRTLDIGGDKMLTAREIPAEGNPFLGWRAIRICLQERDLFDAQLRAILRASVVGNIKMMYPMISAVDELDQANQIVEDCKAQLRAEGLPFQEDLEIGAMVEIPSAAATADALARRAKFLSIGTNDLIQYSLAVDRMNPKIAHLYQPTHPAVLRFIKMTIDAAHNEGIWVGVCGEMAGDPVMAPLLLGLGADELSVAPVMLPSVKFIIRRLKMHEARELAEFALDAEIASEIADRAQTLAESIAPELFEAAKE